MLGQFRVSVDGRECSQWSRQKPKLLVKLLALQAHHELHREQVIETFWPESDPESGRKQSSQSDSSSATRS